MKIQSRPVLATVWLLAVWCIPLASCSAPTDPASASAVLERPPTCTIRSDFYSNRAREYAAMVSYPIKAGTASITGDCLVFSDKLTEIGYESDLRFHWDIAERFTTNADCTLPHPDDVKTVVVAVYRTQVYANYANRSRTVIKQVLIPIADVYVIDPIRRVVVAKKTLRAPDPPKEYQGYTAAVDEVYGASTLFSMVNDYINALPRA